MKDYTVSKSSATVYSIRVKAPHAWADITIEEWPGGGSFKCVSDYGNFSYIWRSIGEGTLREFLCHLDFDYFMKKATEGKYLQFSGEKTIVEIRNQIIKMRRERSITAGQARDCWNELEKVLSESNDSAVFWLALRETEMFRLLYDYDPVDVPSRTEPTPQCISFWEIIWPVVCEIWREELRKEAA